MAVPVPGCTYIFGFGSLVWRPNFPYTERVAPCYIKGWRRVFWQGSTDHRGVPSAPGRTVTLEPDADAVTWGAAFRLAGDAQQQRKTLEYLEWREKQYDLREVVPVFVPGSSEPQLTALTYIATADRGRNPNYLGPAPLDHIARQIAKACGPSGHNYEYLYNLADAMRELGVHDDEELFVLEAKVRALRCAAEEAATEAAVAVVSAAVVSGSKLSRCASEDGSVTTDIVLP